MYHVILKDLPLSVKGFTVVRGGEPCVVLNARLSREQNQESYKHEVDHIRNGDFLQSDSDKIEGTSHEKKNI